jgi:ribosome-associated protein
LNEEQKKRLLENLKSRLTTDGDLIIHSSESRSQNQNKEMALIRLAQEVRSALHVPKKRMATRVSKATKESRFREKTHRSKIKKIRSMKYQED